MRTRRALTAALLAACCTVVGACSGGSTSTATHNSTLAPSSSQGSSTTTSLAPGDAVKAWVAAHGSTVREVLLAIQQVSGTADAATQQKACHTLTFVASNAAHLPPMPDDEIQARWTKALTELARGAIECQGGDITGAQRDLSAGANDFQTLAIVLVAYGLPSDYAVLGASS